MNDPIQPASPTNFSRRLFWILLVTPAALSLTGFLIGQSTIEGLRNVGIGIGFGNCLVGLGASIYCGVWIGKRFCRTDSTRVFAGVGWSFAIGLVNLFIVAVGCVSTVMQHANFH